jgi:hypothetical protein
MILTAHQPVYLPWLGLFHKIALSDIFCIFDDVQYLKKDWNNRNRIKTNSGALWLAAPVLTSGYREKPIREIQINNTIDWRRKHWNTILLAYKKTPYFSRYADFFEDLYKKEWDNLVKLNDYILFYLLNEFGITVEICRASEKKFEGKKNSLVIDMCKKLCADTYIFGALGKDYAEIEKFEGVGVNVAFQDYVHPIYPQLHGKFTPYMSVIDLMFNCGDDSLDIIMSGNVHKQDIEALFCQKG